MVDSHNVNHSLDQRRDNRDGDKLMTFAISGFRPFIELQTQLWRQAAAVCDKTFIEFETQLWRQAASVCEQMAHNYEQALNTLAGFTPSDNNQQQRNN